MLSMTGYGQSTREINNKNYKIELRALNGKTTDVRLKTPPNFNSKELEIRKMVIDQGLRGKFDVSLILESEGGESDGQINADLFKKYYNDLKSLSKDLNDSNGDLIQAVMRMPNVISAINKDLTTAEWNLVKEMTTEALSRLHNYRKEEGVGLKKEVSLRTDNISALLKQVPKIEESRIKKLKEKLQNNLAQHLPDSATIDNNRYEQEILYYLEKLDITEEKVRLERHCEYFLEIANNQSSIKGKKLSFIAQEMGREINTLGAKSQNSDLQQIVVEMKDELEKIKEQIANIL